MPPKHDLSFAGLDKSICKFKISETITSLSKDVKDAPETSTAFVEKPKEVRTSAPLIDELDTNSDNESVFRPKHIPAKINFVKAGESVKPVKSVKHVKPIKPVKTAEQTEKSKNFSSCPKVDRKNWNGKMTQKLGIGFGFTMKAYFICGSMKMEWLRNLCYLQCGKGNWSQGKYGRIPVSAAKPKATTSTSSAKLVNTVRPKQSVNFSNSRSTVHKLHSNIRRSFYNATTHSISYSTKRVNTARSKAVSVVKENGVTAVKASVVDSGCSRHKTGNKAYLADYQEINDGGFVAFGSTRVNDDFSRLSWVFFLATKDETGKVARTMLADSLLPITFWAEAVNTACYVLNRDLVIKLHNKTPYALINGISPRLDFMRPFGCPVTILNTLDPLRKFKGKADEGFWVVPLLLVKLSGPTRYYGNTGTQDIVDAGKEVSDQHHIALPLWSSISSTYQRSDDKAKNDKPKDATGTFSTGGPSSPYPDAFIPDDTLLHMEPKKVAQALDDESWVKEMQDELLQFSLQKVDTFILIGSEEDEKRAGSRKKRAAVDSDKELRKCLNVVPDDDKAINYETLDVKSPIADYESQVLGTIEAGFVHVYKLTRLDGSYKHFLTFSRMLKVLDRQDVLDLHKIVMERFLANDPEGYDLILWGDLKT
nr:retrovirus-related Pol polyprotein from transposon TNT 1-94 [Tanacetum cinerariifolium]